MCILGGDASGHVNHKQGHVTALDGLQGAQDRVFFYAWFDRAPLADASRVDQRNGLALKFDGRIDCIARGAGDRTDDGAFLPYQLIEQAGFASVLLANDRHLDAVIFLFLQWQRWKFATTASSMSPVPVP